MTSEEKAEEILKDYNTTQFYNDGTHDVYTKSAVLYMLHEMAEWKKNNMLNNICNWLMNNAHKYVNSYGNAAYESYQLVEDLRIAIKEDE